MYGPKRAGMSNIFLFNLQRSHVTKMAIFLFVFFSTKSKRATAEFAKNSNSVVYKNTAQLVHRPNMVLSFTTCDFRVCKFNNLKSLRIKTFSQKSRLQIRPFDQPYTTIHT